MGEDVAHRGLVHPVVMTKRRSRHEAPRRPMPFQAQAPAVTTTPLAQPSAGGTADGIPFDIPYGAPISLETAKKLVAAVEADATKHRWKMNIAVVDAHGELVHFSRMACSARIVLAEIQRPFGDARMGAQAR